jgi:hypothetical protein
MHSTDIFAVAVAAVDRHPCHFHFFGNILHFPDPPQSTWSNTEHRQVLRPPAAGLPSAMRFGTARRHPLHSFGFVAVGARQSTTHNDEQVKKNSRHSPTHHAPFRHCQTRLPAARHSPPAVCHTVRHRTNSYAIAAWFCCSPCTPCRPRLPTNRSKRKMSSTPAMPAARIPNTFSRVVAN